LYAIKDKLDPVTLLLKGEWDEETNDNIKVQNKIIKKSEVKKINTVKKENFDLLNMEKNVSNKVQNLNVNDLDLLDID
jgi:hypothetical protein